MNANDAASMQCPQPCSWGHPTAKAKPTTTTAHRPARQTHGVCFAFSYGVNSTNIRIVSTFKPSSRIAVCPS
jgi:hypothetical protein